VSGYANPASSDLDLLARLQTVHFLCCDSTHEDSSLIQKVEWDLYST